MGGQAGTGGKIADAGDAGSPDDAGVCSLQTWMSSQCPSQCCDVCNVTDARTANMINCAIQLQRSPADLSNFNVLVNCTLVLPISSWDADADTPSNPSGWGIDYSVNPARLVFGTRLCQELQMMGNVPIFAFARCGIC